MGAENAMLLRGDPGGAVTPQAGMFTHDAVHRNALVRTRTTQRAPDRAGAFPVRTPDAPQTQSGEQTATCWRSDVVVFHGGTNVTGPGDVNVHTMWILRGVAIGLKRKPRQALGRIQGLAGPPHGGRGAYWTTSLSLKD